MVSLFNSLYGKPVRDITIDEALNRIMSGENIKQIEKLRKAHSENNTKLKNEIKKNELWSVTFGGTFTERKASALKQSSECLVIDLDHVVDAQFFKKYHFETFDQVYAAWISPSGDGVKLLVRIPKVKDDFEYKEYYNSVLKHIDSATADQSTKDISRLCFESYDPYLLRREWVKTAIWTEREKRPQQLPKQVKIDNPRNEDIEEVILHAKEIIKNAPDGQKHFCLRNAARLLGGYVATGFLNESYAIESLETEIKKRNIESFSAAQNTIRNSLNFGKLSPIYYKKNNDIYNKDFNIDFPVEIFPELYQNLIKKLADNLNFPQDYTAVSILYVFSVIMGNRFKVSVKSGYITVPISWFCVVGDPGVTKSHPITKIIKPLNNIDAENYRRYKVELSEWAAIENNHDVKPYFKKYLIDDFTFESLPKIIDCNKNGVGIYSDELASWVDNLNRYTNGNVISKFLTLYDNGTLKIDRKTQEPELIENVFLSIIGTMQPGILIEMFEKYSKNGFFDRFLYSFPNTEIKPLPIYDIEIPELIEHDTIIRACIDAFPNLDQHENIMFKFENQQDYFDINSWLVEKMKSDDVSPRMISYTSKLITNIPRLAIIIETINEIVVNNSTPFIISSNSMKKCFNLIKYFFTNAEKLLVDFNKQKEIKAIINGFTFQKDKVVALRKANYKFSEIAKILSISEQVAKNYAAKK